MPENQLVTFLITVLTQMAKSGFILSPPARQPHVRLACIHIVPCRHQSAQQISHFQQVLRALTLQSEDNDQFMVNNQGFLQAPHM